MRVGRIVLTAKFKLNSPIARFQFSSQSNYALNVLLGMHISNCFLNLKKKSKSYFKLDSILFIFSYTYETVKISIPVKI